MDLGLWAIFQEQETVKSIYKYYVKIIEYLLYIIRFGIT